MYLTEIRQWQTAKMETVRIIPASLTILQTGSGTRA
jgi:hypothetical protein